MMKSIKIYLYFELSHMNYYYYLLIYKYKSGT